MSKICNYLLKYKPSELEIKLLSWFKRKTLEEKVEIGRQKRKRDEEKEIKCIEGKIKINKIIGMIGAVPKRETDNSITIIKNKLNRFSPDPSGIISDQWSNMYIDLTNGYVCFCRFRSKNKYGAYQLYITKNTVKNGIVKIERVLLEPSTDVSMWLNERDHCNYWFKKIKCDSMLSEHSQFEDLEDLI